MGRILKYNCVFGGGGIRGMCYIGALKALTEQNIELDSVAGSSVGAVFAALYAAGYNADEIKNLFMDFNFNMFRDLNINIFNTDISFSKGEIFLDWLREKIAEKVLGKNSSKKDKVLFKDIDKDIYILTVDLNTNTPFIFSKDTTPDEEIAVAVRASAGLPGLMKPVSYNNLLLVDGDLIKSWPAWKIYSHLNFSKNRLLEFRLEGSRDGSDIKNPVDYLNSIINSICFFSTENVYNTFSQNDKFDFIVIDTKDLILFDFTIDKNSKVQLIEKGYNVTKNYFEKTIIQKRQKILSIYITILNKIKVLKKTLSGKKAEDILPVINEILSTMKDDTEFIDEAVYKKIKELKEEIVKNIKNSLFSKKIINEELIKEKNEFILKYLEEKIEEIK